MNPTAPRSDTRSSKRAHSWNGWWVVKRAARCADGVSGFAGWREGAMQGVRRKEWERPIGGRRLLLQHVMCRGWGLRAEGEEREVDSFVPESRI